MFNVNEYLNKTRVVIQVPGLEFCITEVRPHITLKDGTVLSLQAGQFLYCSPRFDTDFYTKIEVGLIETNGVEIDDHPFTEKFHEYQEGEGCFVFSYVPVDDLEEWINQIGVKEQ